MLIKRDYNTLIDVNLLTQYTIGDLDPVADARALRDFLFSKMPVGSSITKPYWLSAKTEFDAITWFEEIIKPGGKILKRTINFDIELYNGTRLSDPMNATLLQSFQYWIAYQVHPRYTGGDMLSPAYAHAQLTKALQLADFIIINGEYFKICEHGFALVSENSINNLLADLTNRPTSEGIYEYRKNLTTWIKDRLHLVTDQDVTEALKSNAFVAVTDDEVRTLDFDAEQLLKARVLLMKLGFYDTEHGTQVFRAAPIIADIYKNTLNGLYIKPRRFSELDLGEKRFKGEFPAVEVRANQYDGASHKVMDRYIETLRKIALIKECDTGVAQSTLMNISKDRIIAGKTFAAPGRYRTAPVDVTLLAIKNSIEFCFENADWILDAVCTVVEAKSKIESDSKISFQDFAMIAMPQAALAHGITQWSLTRSDAEFYNKLRANSSLAELYQVLIGSVQILVGAVMARRRDELIDLDGNACLVDAKGNACSDPLTNPELPENANKRYFLVFQGEKTGAAGNRQTLRRPLLRVAAIFIYKLMRFGIRLRELGLDNGSGKLFKNISRLNGLVTDCAQTMHYNNFNIACDYFQLPTINIDNIEKRYYIRQHQLRRFFAIAFFWGTDNPDFKTLSYMLGHTDARMFYLYVTEHVTGRILREAKANRIQASLISGAHDIEGIDILIDKLRKEYNARQVHVKTYAEVFVSIRPLHDAGIIKTAPSFEEYVRSYSCEGDILQYLNNGAIILEPDFFEVQTPERETVSRFNLVLKVKDLE
jgi:hypothetical protein